MSFERFSFCLMVLGLMLSCPEETQADKPPGFVSIFDGQTLKNWRTEPATGPVAWTVKDGVIHGEGQEDRLAYLIYSGNEDLKDFELKFSYRMVTKGNSGVEVRTRIDKTGKRPFEGYHADIGHVGIGKGVLGAWDFHFGKGTRKELPCPRGTRLIIDEKGDGKPFEVEGAITLDEIKKHDWNQGHIVAKGRTFTFLINGKLASEFTDNIKNGVLESGFIGLQLHDKGMVVQFKDVLLKKSS